MKKKQRHTDSCYLQFGRACRKLRKARGMSQAELAKRVGLTRCSITNIEAGRQNFAAHFFGKVAKAFNISRKQMIREIYF